MKRAIRRLFVAVVFATPAYANAGSFSFQTTSGCASEQEFLTLVEQRGGSLDPADERSFAIVLARRSDAFVGRLLIRANATEEAEPREIRGKTCAEVADALSITLALELRPRVEPAPSPPEAPPPAPVTVPVPTAATPAPTTRNRWGHRVATVTEGKLHLQPRFAITLSAGASFGLFPLVATRYDATFRMASFVTLPNGEQSIIGPILRGRLGFVGSPQRAWASGESSVTVSGQSLGLGLCWSPHYDPAGLVLLGCGELGLAGYSTRVQSADGRRHDSGVSLLGTFGPVLEAEYGLGPLHVGARLGGNLVFGRVDAAGADGERLFQSKRWEAFLALGVGGHW